MVSLFLSGFINHLSSLHLSPESDFFSSSPRRQTACIHCVLTQKGSIKMAADNINRMERLIQSFLLPGFRLFKQSIIQTAGNRGYVFLAIFLFLSPAMASADGFLPPVYHLLFHQKKSSLRIFILGSSTVHTANYISGDFNDPHGADRKLQGWEPEI